MKRNALQALWLILLWLSDQEKIVTATAAWIGHGILEINGAGVSCRIPYRIKRQGHPFGVPPVAMALWWVYLSTTCQPSSVLTRVTAAVRFSLSTIAVTLHL